MDGGERVVIGRGEPTGGKPAGADSKDEQGESEDEVGNDEKRGGARGDEFIGRATKFGGAPDAEGKTDEPGEKRSTGGEEKRVTGANDEQRCDGRVVSEGKAEVAVSEAVEPVEVANRKRAIELRLGPEGGDGLR